MRSSPYTTSRHPRERQPPPARKKACQSCTRSKVRCDLERPACSRCRSLGRTCEYATSALRSISPPPGEPATGNPSSSYIMPSMIGTPHQDLGSLAAIPTAHSRIDSTPRRPLRRALDDQIPGWLLKDKRPDWTNIKLIPSETAVHIRDRWLRPYVLPTLEEEEIPKLYPHFTIQYLSRVLSTYPRFMAQDNSFPPYIHNFQVIEGELPETLANCCSLVRMWVNIVPGSEQMVIGCVEAEMDRLVRMSPDESDYELLIAFQAYLTYTIMMYFSPLNGLNLVSDKAMIALMEVAFRTASNGLQCVKEYPRPSWESWIVCAAKRRTILTMYLFSSVYNANNGLPNFRTEELGRIPVPEPKALWEATNWKLWARGYEDEEDKWCGQMLEMRELWRSEETGTPQRTERVERWLQTVDEFGMMLFAVCAHIHGC